MLFLGGMLVLAPSTLVSNYYKKMSAQQLGEEEEEKTTHKWTEINTKKNGR